MKEELVNKIIQGMLMILDNAQMSHLLEVLNYALFGYEIRKMEGVEEEDIEQENKRVLDSFIAAKNIEGCSEKSLQRKLQWISCGLFAGISRNLN